MLMMNERLPAVPTLRGWAISGSRRRAPSVECEEHGWMKDRADPHSRELALVVVCPGSAVWRFTGRSCYRDQGRPLIPARSAHPIAARLLPASHGTSQGFDQPLTIETFGYAT
ncbi:hypothetical protein V1286_001198 [Bradyrhizobium algeriense]|uniref:Transposase n=1 Tax=Bradyrhizobium algeriense TaxID=634784 RepID=A0ABU8B561_9BRAD